MHKLKQIWGYFLDQNHLETPKVMTLTFDLENGKHSYLVKPWYIIYLDTKFEGCNLKAVFLANLYITLLQRRKRLQWPLVTFIFEMWSPKKLYNPGVCLTFVPIMKLIRLLVSEEYAKLQTHKQRGLRYHNIDDIYFQW